MIRLLSAFCVSLIIVGNLFAWDGQRKGFVLGVGLGHSITSYKVTKEYPETEYYVWEKHSFPMTQMGYGVNFKFGFAPNNRLMLYWTTKTNWFQTAEISEDVETDILTTVFGIGSFSFSYFFNAKNNSPFISSGIGYSNWFKPFESNAKNNFGLGFFVGFGYEFTPHLMVELNYCWGNAGDERLEGYEYLYDSGNVFGFLLSINVLGY